MVAGGLPLLLLGLLAAPVEHPTHTSAAEVIARGDSVLVAIRIFADDLAGTGDLRRYVARRFGIVDGKGTPVRLEWAGSEPTDDVLVVRLRGRAQAGLSRAVIRHQILTERFTDQVNLVRATYGGRTATLVFVGGEGPKALP